MHECQLDNIQVNLYHCLAYTYSDFCTRGSGTKPVTVYIFFGNVLEVIQKYKNNLQMD